MASENHKTYNHKTSKTSQYGHDFDTKIQKISPGVPVSDTITIGNMKIRNVSFLSTTVSSLFSSKPYDGIVGLQYNSSLLYHCKKLGLKTTFSLYTDYPWDNNTSELMLCGEDKTKFQGNLQYVGLSSRQDNGWNIAMQSILLHHNDKSVPIMEFQGSFELTPSSSYITGPEEFIEKIYKALNATTSKISNIKEVDCKTIHTLPSISFRTADQDYFTLTGNDYITQLTQNDQRVCMVRLISHVTNSWIIGNVFTRKFYTVFDLEVDRIGFAESIHDNVRNSASTVIIINNVILIIVPIFFMIY
ncbi:cathepsin D-like isoform X2 [Planococcus citri]|uniref:cathepsin D-like isoform X2 n=1 Tax=Planococcus citri TaxID=170843 RepID=UPI0031FA1E92